MKNYNREGLIAILKTQGATMKRIICWKHNRQTDERGYCSECNGVPPEKPKAYSDSIKEASVKLSYAFGDIKNEGMRHSIAESWEYKLRELIKQQNYDIVEVKNDAP